MNLRHGAAMEFAIADRQQRQQVRTLRQWCNLPTMLKQIRLLQDLWNKLLNDV